ncbi:histidine phosphatase family protein [Chelativorans sp. M5D2P16]|uniref:SixA phosphatase family protein n=1 Tax=Chelativorans sp. M5D2P16 TaxID=3095678 RepID=UPI002AC9F950|nr:histidine phosphatase family protein [Chelativorans sp. M5D2P16]MDZ5698021.1 histidine phosphatase family protein [Chelativorans sp. M5D2P16]
MKELLLLRHAKSSWDDPSLDDFDRPLAPRGRKAAPLMGRTMATRGWVPDRVLVSAALRTRQTWRRVAPALGEGVPQAEHDKDLYMASAARILKLINGVPADTRRLLVVGHNPGIGDLALRLAAPDSDPAALARMEAKFPTAALAHFTFAQPWSALETRSARLTAFLRPKELA